MKNPLRRMRFYIALPDLVVVLFGLALFCRPVARAVLHGADWLTGTVQWPEWVGSLALNVLSDVIAAVFIAGVAILLIWSRRRHALAGTFKAFDLTNGKGEEWGEVRLRHQLAATSILGPVMRLELRHEDIVLHGEGVIVQEQHFVGFYRDISQPVRRRCGAFFMTLGGEANSYEGQFIYLDPKTSQPALGRARWVRT